MEVERCGGAATRKPGVLGPKALVRCGSAAYLHGSVPLLRQLGGFVRLEAMGTPAESKSMGRASSGSPMASKGLGWSAAPHPTARTGRSVHVPATGPWRVGPANTRWRRAGNPAATRSLTPRNCAGPCAISPGTVRCVPASAHCSVQCSSECPSPRAAVRPPPGCLQCRPACPGMPCAQPQFPMSRR